MADPVVNQGFAFPLRVDAQGGIAAAQGADAIRLAVLALLGTQPGERQMRPTYGCPLRSLAFAPNNAATANLARFYVADALARWEPRASVAEIRVTNLEDANGSSLLIELRYTVRATGQTDQVAFQLPLA